MKTQDIDYSFGGKNFRGCLVYDETISGQRPGVLVVHEGWGFGKHAMARAEKLAGLGYVAFAADMFGDRKQMADFPQMMEQIGALFGDFEEFRGRAKAALAVLAEQPQTDASRLGAIGFCFGGSTVLELARSGADVKGVVSFHGGLTPALAAEPGGVKASILVCTGADDPMITPANREAFEAEMRHAGADWQLVAYGNAVHSFTNAEADGSLSPAIHYEERADKRSWTALKSFFAEVFA